MLRKICGGDTVGGKRGAGVEPEPAEPQQADAEQHERQVVRTHRLGLETRSAGRGPAPGPGRRAGDDLDHQAAGVVECADLREPAVRIPHPVRDGDVDEQRPDRHEEHPRRELRAVGDRTADQRCGEDRERQLEGREQHLRNLPVHGRRVDARHAEVFESADDAAVIVAEREAVPDEQPHHGDQGDRDETHHDHVEDALGADHAAVEQGQARRHEQHEGGADQQPGGCAGIDCFGHVSFSSRVAGRPQRGTDDRRVRFHRRCRAVANMFRKRSAIAPAPGRPVVGSPVVFARGPVPEVSTSVVRRGGGAGACHRTAEHRTRRRTHQPCLPVLRPAWLRKDVVGAHPGALAQLRAGAHVDAVRCVLVVCRPRPGRAGNLDVIELDAASHGGVDDTRELRDRAFYAPAESRYRVFIVDEAHMVTTAGFNALLKIVEEPPEHLIFIFATTEPEKVLPTIRSRTHHYPFRLLAPSTMRGLLEKICAQEHVPVEDAVYPLVIRAGGGSPRDSLSVLDQLLAGAGDEGVRYARALALLGVTDVALIDEAVDALAANDGAALFGTVDKVMDAGHDPRRFAVDLLERLRDLILMRAVPDAAERGLVDAPGDRPGPHA